MEHFLYVKVKPFKQIYKLEGIAPLWGNHPDLVDGGLPAKYKMNVPIRVARNRANITNVNVYVDNMIIGFINLPKSLKILQALSKDQNVHGKIVKVVHAETTNEPPSEVQIEVSTYKRGTERSSANLDESQTKNVSGNRVQKPDATAHVRENSEVQKHPHRLLGVPFKVQRVKSKFIRENWYKSGIYCIWTDTHETYIGQSKTIGCRAQSHIKDLDSGRHGNKRLQADWKKHGQAKFRFDVIEYVEDLDSLDAREEFFIKEFFTYTHGYNATADGQGIPGYIYKAESGVEIPPTSGTRVKSPDERTPADMPEKKQESEAEKPKFGDLFDGRYYLIQCTRMKENGIVRIVIENEVWCYKISSQYHASLLVKWFAQGRRVSGASYDWLIENEKFEDDIS